MQYLEPDVPGMHTTPTIDFEVVVCGEIVLELDNGASVTLGQETRSCRTGRAIVGAMTATSRQLLQGSSAAHITRKFAAR